MLLYKACPHDVFRSDQGMSRSRRILILPSKNNSAGVIPVTVLGVVLYQSRKCINFCWIKPGFDLLKLPGFIACLNVAMKHSACLFDQG